MIPQFLAVVTIGTNGDITNIQTFFIAALPFIFLIVAVALAALIKLTRIRLEHKQIMAAIEKGTPLSDLRPVKKAGTNWIRGLSLGIAFLIMGIGLAIIVLSLKNEIGKDASAGLFLAVALFSMGIGGIVCGILKRKDEKALSSEKSDNRMS